MTDNQSLQDLVNHVNTLDQKIQSARLCSISMFNDAKLSEFHSRFDNLMKKYSEFAEEYKVELGEFHQSLLTEIKLNQLKELRRQNELERLQIEQQIEDVISNSNTEATEIVDNLPEIDMDSSATSSKYDDVKSVSSTVPHTPQLKVTVKTPPKPVHKAAPIRKAHLEPSKHIRKIATSHKVQKKKDNTKKNKIMDKPYQYDVKRVRARWRFSEPQRSSTVIFIGNLPSNWSVCTEKDLIQTQKKIGFFVRQRANVTMTQIEEIVLKTGSRGMYALVRFRSDVSLQRITKFVDKINRENEALFKNNKEKNKKKDNESWKKRVFIRLNRNIVKSGDAMWNDNSANHTLFINCFDILNIECHYELTNKLLEYGDLYDDINIRIDSFGDPFCIATFKYINDAIYCCNSEIEFNGRILHSRYSKY